MIFALPAVIISAKLCCVCNTEWYRSGHNGADSKFLEAPAVSSAENVHRTGLCAGSDFTISYCSCVFFLHSSGAGITLEVYGELSERSKVRHSKCRVPKRNLGFESLTLRQKPSHIKAFAHMTGLFFLLICHCCTCFSARSHVCHPTASVSGRVRTLSMTFADISLDL